MKPLHPDFEKHWEGADVVLIAENSNGKKLYAQKAPLAKNSSYFNSMFFSRFREASQATVNVPCSYETMLEILRLVYSSICTHEQKLSSVDEMVKLYLAADMFDFKHIKNICITRMKKEPNKGILAAFNIGGTLMMEILEQMLPADVRKFLEIDDERLFFSKDDVYSTYKFLTKEKLRKAAYTPKKAGIVQKLDEVATEVEKPRIDLTKKWFMSDVSISTRNSDGKLLYSNKTILVSFSKLFRKMFISSNDDVSVSKKDFPVIAVDVEFITMKTILSIIHQCDTDFCHHTAYHPLLLYDMYHTVSKHELDFPLIRKLCADNLIEQATPGCLEVAIKLNLPRVKALILERMSSDELRKWLSSGDKDLIYRDLNGEEVIVSTKATSAALSINHLRVVINTLEKKRPSEQVKKPPVTPTIPIDDPHVAYRYEFDDGFVNMSPGDFLQKDPSPRTLGLFMNH